MLASGRFFHTLLNGHSYKRKIEDEELTVMITYEPWQMQSFRFIFPRVRACDLSEGQYHDLGKQEGQTAIERSDAGGQEHLPRRVIAVSISVEELRQYAERGNDAQT